MFISVVDNALRNYLVRAIRSSTSDVEISFETPTPEWSARRHAATVNLFLHRVERSNAIARTPQRRFDANGRPERRATNVTMVDLNYVVSVWCADAGAEHDLLSQVVSLLAATSVLPAECVPNGLASPVTLTFGSTEPTPDGPLSVAGPLKAYAMLTVSVATDVDRQDDTAALAVGADSDRG